MYRMKYVTLTIWMLCSSALPLVSSQLNCSSSGEYVVISNKLVKKVIPDQSIVQPYQPDIRIPDVCSVDRACNSLILEMENKESRQWEKHIWAPNIGHTHYFILNENTTEAPRVTNGPILYASNCFKFFHVQNRRMGALCIENKFGEDLVVPYKILYDEQGTRLQENPLGIKIHLNLENHSPFIFLNGTEEFEVIGISYYEHLSSYKLVVIHFNGESKDIFDVPSNCSGPHDVQPIGQSDVIIRCANGKVLYYNVWYSTFTMLTHNNIALMSTCTNTTWFVLVQEGDKIIFNKSGVIYQVLLNNSGQPLTIASAVCYADSKDEITYYYADATTNAVYKLYLGDIPNTKQALVPQLIRDDVGSDGRLSLYNDGPILWGRLTSNHSDVIVYITNLLSNRRSPSVSVNGPSVFVQLYTPGKCEEVYPTETTDQLNKKQDDSNGQVVGDTGIILIVLGVVVLIIVLAIVIVAVLIILHRHSKRPVPSMDNESIENGMDPFSGQQHDNHDDGSQSVGSNDNSEVPLIPEQYAPQSRPLVYARITGNHSGNHSWDTTPVQITNRQPAELVSQNAELVPGVGNKAKPPTQSTPASNSAPSKLEEVD